MSDVKQKFNVGDLVRFNKEYIKLYEDEAIGMVVENDEMFTESMEKQYITVWWFDLQNKHRE